MYGDFQQSPMMQYYERFNAFGQPQPQAMAVPQQGGQIIRVNGENGARAFSMPPNSAAILLDENMDVFYLKSTDGAGYPTINAYEFKPLQKAAPVPTADYVTRAEFDELKGMNDFNEFKKSLQGKNPNEILNNVMNSGKYSQAQFEKAKQMAQQFSALLK